MIYRVYLNGTLFFDTDIDELALISPVLTKEYNKAGSFNFTVPNTHPLVNEVEALTCIVGVFYIYPGFDTEHLLFCGPVTKVIETMLGEKQVYCEGALSLLNRKYYTDMLKISFTSPVRTVESVFTTLLALAGDEINGNKISLYSGGCNVTNTQNVPEIAFDNYPTRMEAVMKLQEVFGGHFEINATTISIRKNSHTALYNLAVYYKKDIINTSMQELVMGQNLISLDVDIDEPNVFNTVLPIGAKANVYSRYKGTTSKVQSLIDKYGTIERTVTYDDQTSTTVLTALGQQYIKDNLYKSITAKARFVDLSNIDNGFVPLDINYKVKVFSPKQDINREMLIIGRTFNLTDPGNDTLTLSATEEYDVS